MYRREMMYNAGYRQHPFYPYRSYGPMTRPPYEMYEPMPDMNIYPPQYYPNRRIIPYGDYPPYEYVQDVYLPPPIVQTNVHNDVCYHVDDPNIICDGDHNSPCRLPRSRVQFFDIAPKTNFRTTHQRQLVTSTYEPVESPKRILLPRSNGVRHTSLPAYRRTKPVRLVPLYHSADPQYVLSNRREKTKEVIPVATVYSPQRRTIKVRSLSP